MAFCLSEYVCSGEIVNTLKNSVHGYFAFHGCDRPVILQLTGNCGEELKGRHLRFEVRPSSANEELTVTEDDIDQMHLAWIQIGVPGEMRIRRTPETLDRSTENTKTSDASGDKRSSRFQPCLHLEWFGPNGHTVIQLVDPLIEFVDEEHQAADIDALTAESGEASPWDDPHHESSSASNDQMEDIDAGDWTDPAFYESDDDPFHLFPQDLESRLDSSLPQSPWNAELDDNTLAQWKDWDEVVDGTKDVPLSSLFDPPLKLPPAEAMDDEQVARQLNRILSRLALHNVAFHMCEHSTPRSAYKLLLERILPEQSTHPELPRIGFTMNFDTSEFCEECDAEFERRDAERRSNRGPDDLSDDNAPDDDVPL